MLLSQTELSSNDSLIDKDKLFTINKLSLGFDLFKPIKSSVTKTCPSQLIDDPMPIVGIFIFLVICQ